MNKYTFEDIVLEKKGFLRGPFGGDLKKEIFVPRGDNTYKVYEQSVVLQSNSKLGRYYISKEYFDHKMHRFSVEPKDFLVSCSGVNYGAIFQLGDTIEKGVINQALLRIRLNNKIIDNNYFFYFFKHYLVNMIIGRKGDSTIPNFPPVSVIKKLEFRLPTLDIQKYIGNMLQKVDKKIELNNKINQELETMAKTLYDYWFVQFDFPDTYGKPYKSSGSKMVYSEELKREIPEGWEVDIVNNVLAKTDKSKKIPSKEILSIGDIPVIDQSTDFICGFTNDKDSLIIADVPRIIFGDHTRILKFINFDFARGADGTQVLLSNNSNMPQHLFFYVLKSIDLSNYGYARHFKFLKESKIIIPNENISNRFEEIVGSFYKQIKNNIFETQKLTKLRDWLLPMLMNGQVKVADAGS